MNNTNNAKSLLSILLSIVIMLASIPLGAATAAIISNTEHKQNIERFISEIKAIQSQVSEVAQIALNPPPSKGDTELKLRINSINSNIESLNKVIQDYLATVPGVNERNRHVLLTFNVINLIKSNLYTLNALLNATTDEERLALSQEYSKALSTALDTLAILESSLEKFKG